MVELAELAVPTSHSQVTSLGIHSLFLIQTVLLRSQQDGGPLPWHSSEEGIAHPSDKEGTALPRAAPE